MEAVDSTISSSGVFGGVEGVSGSGVAKLMSLGLDFGLPQPLLSEVRPEILLQLP